MVLSDELVSQFVKATNDDQKSSTESTVYGTTVELNGKLYVRIDGSDRLTPVTTTTDMKVDERVTVSIKNHTATVTGNISNPAAHPDSVKDVATEVNNKINEFDTIVAKKADVDDLRADVVIVDEKLTAVEGVINKLDVDELTVESLEAKYAKIDLANITDATIENLSSKIVNTDVLNSKYATIEGLTATDADIYNLKATYATIANVEAKYATIEKLEATDAKFDTLDSKYATITELDVEKGRIDDLEATTLTAESATIKNLQSDVADIDTLIFGTASGTSIQTSFANAVIAQLGNAQIKSAMIENIDASQINAGKINTNAVNIGSEDGRMLLSDETIQISDENRVRVQIGKDAAGDYSINIWDAEGNLMFSEGGITDSAIKEAIIRNDMVASDANIAASKLDISSLFTEINGSEQTINSSKILMDADGQTLNVAFTQMSSDVEDLSKDVESQGTSLSVIQGQIESKVWQQDIDTSIEKSLEGIETEVETLTTNYSSLTQDVDSVTQTVAEHTTQISNKADSSTVTEVNDRVTEVETNLEGFKSTVSDTYVRNDTLDGYYTIEQTNSAIDQSKDAIELSVSKTYATNQRVDNLKIGGRNLIRNSETLSFANYVFASDTSGILGYGRLGHLTLGKELQQ